MKFTKIECATSLVVTLIPLPIVVAAGLLSSACSSGSTPHTSVSPTLQSSGRAIHVYSLATAAAERVDFSPVEERIAAPTAVIEGPDGAATTTSDNSTTPSAWALVWGAAGECGLVGESLRAPPNTLASMAATVPPWSTQNSWYIFPRPPANCDEVLAYEEALVCVADHLSNVADTVSTITWSGSRYEQPPLGAPPEPWSIPPQADVDKFVARDLAINVLAQIPKQLHVDPGSRKRST